MLEQIDALIKIEKERRKRRSERMKDFSTQQLFYQKHPFNYMVERLGVRPESLDWSMLPEYANHKWDGTPNPLMAILNNLAQGITRIGVESATGPGKTYLGACIVFWFLECFENSLVVTTAPKQDQLSLHIWKEIGRMHDKFGRGDLISLKLRMIPGKDDWIAVGFVAGIVANEESSTKAQGFHEEHMLIIIEETPGVPSPIITAFQNTCTAPHNIILAFGNPDHQLDNLHKFCSLPNVEHITISAYDHPNIVLDDASFIPGACSQAGIKDMLVRYGSRENPLFLSRARGISPGQSEDALIRLEWLNAAAERYKALTDERGKIDIAKILGDAALGVDVANSEAGDKAALAHGKGDVLLSVIDFHCPDSTQLGKRDVYHFMKEKNIIAERVGVDGVGVGAGTINGLKELGIRVTNLIGSEKQVTHKEAEDFRNLRSQMYWQVREDLRNDIIAIPYDPDLFADLVTPKWITRNGEIIVESKEEIKKRLGHSPNKGDAVVYWNWIRSGKAKRKITAGSNIF